MSILTVPSGLPFHNRTVISGPWTPICQNELIIFVWSCSKHAQWLQSVCITATVTQFLSSQKERRLSSCKLLDTSDRITGTNIVCSITMKGDVHFVACTAAVERRSHVLMKEHKLCARAEVSSRLVRSALSCSRGLLTFRRKILPPSSELKSKSNK
jgi:hypothetical protein